VTLLLRLSHASGLNILTNTGLYGTRNGKYLPEYAFSESAGQMAKRWIAEWENGIEGTGIKPGFIKISVDKAPIRDFQQNIVKAAAITHLKTGLTIVSHTGEAGAALEQIEIIKRSGVHPSAFIWVHAQAEKDPANHLQVVRQGAWASYDGVAWESPGRYLELIDHMKKNGYLDHVLLSHDAGWYHVGEPGGGDFKGFTAISEQLIPLLQKAGYKSTDIKQLLHENPANAFEIKVRKIKS
jgi:phosphotriesterase-related protein